ncbi:MAG: hypothetical protein QOI96_1737 [Verrucomicrobiota bacterium]|jgi:uncharacterized membrane protein
MLRAARMKREPEIVHGFRMRGREVTRLESFSDAVFGFAVTLLVISLEVPRSYDQLIETMQGSLAFAACFAILAMIWNDHYVFSRRFGLQDGFVRFLTSLLLFIVLLYVYPLKFLFNLFINGMILHGARGQLTLEQATTFFVIYGMGFSAVFLAFTALYVHAYQRRAELELTPLEALDTRWEIYGLLWQAAVGVVSIIIALSQKFGNWPGYIYFSLFPIMSLHGLAHRRHRRRLFEEVS